MGDDTGDGQQARAIRDGVIGGYESLIADLMMHARNSGALQNDKDRERYDIARARLRRMVIVLCEFESAIEKLRERDGDPTAQAQIQILRSKARELRDAALLSAEKIVLSLSRRLSVKPGQ